MISKQRYFSLIVSTIGRYEELEDFFQSLTRQTYKLFSVVLVDQNQDSSWLNPLIDKYRQFFDILHLTSQRGLSRARNIGLKSCCGDIVAFPDDDCVYPERTLERVNAAFAGDSVDIVIGRQVPFEKIDLCGSNKCDNIQLCKFSIDSVYSLFKDAPSITLFFSYRAIIKTGYFDESIGVGAGTLWGSGEDTDYLIRAFQNGCVVRRYPNLDICHASIDYDKVSLLKVRAYGRGRGYLIRKHHLGIIFAIVNILYPLFKLLFVLRNTMARRYYLSQCIGRLEGFFRR